MKIHSVALTNFMSHASTTLTIPDTGALVITGPNGAGKSSFVEAVAWCLWGKTLRGHKPWRDGERCEATILTPTLRVTRSRTVKGKLSLAWTAAGEPPDTYDTVTKAQEALALYIPTFASWRQTHVLTSADAARFTMATDAERKRLLEEVLGVEGIDHARGAAKTDLMAARNAEREAEARLAGMVQGRAQAEAALAALDVPVTVSQSAYDEAVAQQGVHAEAIASARADARAFEQDIRLTVGDVATHRAHIRTSDQRRAHLSVSVCPTCEQAIDGAHKESLTATLHQERTDLEDRLSDSLADKGHAQAVLDEVREELRDAERAHAAAVLTMDTFTREQQTRRDADVKKAHLATVLADGDALSAQYTGEATEAARRQRLLTAVVALFGAKGFRGHLLASSVAGLQTLANRWLRVLSNRLSVRLAITDAGAVEIALDGAGGGHGYAGASGGERRRVDVALTLALCELATVSSGEDEGTLWLDEVFDSLDGEGVSGVSSAVSTLCASRGIVLITHSADVAALPQATRLSVGTEDGDGEEENTGEGETPER